MSVAQYMSALKLANDTRLKRAELKREIAVMPTKDGYEAVVLACTANLNFTKTMRLRDLLESVQLVGAHRSAAVMKRAGMGHDKRIGEISQRQLRVLADVVAKDPLAH